MRRIAVIGGGAAGCFAAVEIARRCPEDEVTVFEAGHRLMSKLSVTGGGRCNITNDFNGIRDIREAYPRGGHLIRRALAEFSHTDCLEWFGREGVSFVTQSDHCIFPESQDAMQIVHTLENAMRREGVKIECSSAVTSIEEGFILHLRDSVREADVVLVTTGGGALGMLSPLNLRVENPVPSLFTFRLDDPALSSLMGTTVPETVLLIPGTRFRSSGILLVTDWGISGPATLKLSSYAARYLAESGYRAPLLINWTSETEEECRKWITQSCLSDRTLQNLHPDGISERLWTHILVRAGLKPTGRWRELGRNGINRLAAVITGDEYRISGRAAFKEEFVTCGGVSLDEINPSTMESKRFKGLFFAGEVLDIDAVTGGFNLQAAWSTAFCAARGIFNFSPPSSSYM